MGKSEIVWRTLRATESCFNVFSYIDFSKYTGFFTAMTEFNTDTTARAGKAARSYDLNHGLTPRYCDLKQVYPSGNTIYSAIRPNSGSLTDDAIVNINTLIATLRSNGVKYYFGCAPICYYDAKGTKPTDKELDDFYKRAVENLQCPVISHPKNYLYNTLQYCNSSYHLDTENAGVHSLRVVADIKAQLESEK